MSRPSPRAWHRAEHLFVVTALLALGFTLLARGAARLPHGGPLDRAIEGGVHARLPQPALALLRGVSFFGSTTFIAAGCLGVAIALGRMGARRRLLAFLLA